MMRYAQVDGTGVCFADSELATRIEAENMIQLTADEPSPIGKRWAGTEWVEVPPPGPEEEPDGS